MKSLQLKTTDKIRIGTLLAVLFVLVGAVVWLLGASNTAKIAEPAKVASQRVEAVMEADAASNSDAQAPPVAPAQSADTGSSVWTEGKVDAPSEPVVFPGQTSDGSEVKEAERLTAVEAELGMQKKELPVRSQGLVFKFVMETEPRCELGDLDVIDKDLKYSKNARLLLSLESLVPDDESFQPVVRRLNPANLMEGYRVTLRVPAHEGVRHLGIFLCSDPDNVGRCFNSQKQIRDLNHVFRQYVAHEQKIREEQIRLKEKGLDPNSAKIAAIEAEAKIYYFSYLLVKNNVVTVLDNQMPDDRYVDLKAHIGKTTTIEKADILTKRVKALNTVLRSISVDFDSDQRRMTLNFPRYDMRRCENQ